MENRVCARIAWAATKGIVSFPPLIQGGFSQSTFHNSDYSQLGRGAFKHNHPFFQKQAQRT